MANKNKLSADLVLTPVMKDSEMRALLKQLATLDDVKNKRGLENSKAFKDFNESQKDTAIEARNNLDRLGKDLQAAQTLSKQYQLNDKQRIKLNKAAALTDREFQARGDKKSLTNLRSKEKAGLDADKKITRILGQIDAEKIKTGTGGIPDLIEKTNARLHERVGVLRDLNKVTDTATTKRKSNTKVEKAADDQLKKSVALTKAQSKAQDQRTTSLSRYKKAFTSLRIGKATEGIAPNIVTGRRNDTLQAAKQMVKAQEGVLALSTATGDARGREVDLLRKMQSRVDALKKGQEGVKQAVENTKKSREKSAQVARTSAEESTRARKVAARAQQQESIRIGRAIRDQQVSKTGSFSGANLSNTEFAAVSKGMSIEADRIATRLGKVTVASQRSAEAQIRLAGRLDRTKAALTEQRRAMGQLNREYSAAHGPLGQLSRLMRQFFRYALGFGALYQVLNAVTALVGGLVDLDAQLKSIQAISDSTDDSMLKLESTIKRVAVTTKFTTKEIAQAARVLAQAGVEADELPSALTAAADFAAGTESSLAIATDLLTTMRNVFTELDDVTIANQLAKAVNISKLTAKDLTSIVSISAQVAKSFSLTSEQYFAAVATLRNAGLKASTVATGLRQGLTEVFSPNTKTLDALAERYEEIGETLNNAKIKSKFFGFSKNDNPLIAVLTELKRLGFAKEAQKKFQRALNVRGTNAIVALINDLDGLREAEKRITFGKAAAEAADVQMRSLDHSLKNLGAAMTVFGDQILGGAVNPLETMTDGVTSLITKLVDLDNELKSLGQNGLISILGKGLLGGAIGANFGKGGKGKALGALGGFAVGGAAEAGAQKLEITGSALGSIAAPIATAIAFTLGDRIFGKGKGGGKSAAILGAGAGAVKGPSGSGLLGKFTASATAGALISKGLVTKLFSAVARFLGPIGLAFTAVQGIFFLLELATGDSQRKLKETANALQAASDTAERARAEVEVAQTTVDEFDVAQARRLGGFSGTTASTVVSLVEEVKGLNARLVNILGQEIPANARAAIDRDLQVYSKLVGSSRLAFLQGDGPLATLLKGKDLAKVDSKLFAVSEALSALPNSVNALLEDSTTQIIQANDLILDAVSRGIDVTHSIDNLLKIKDVALRDAIILLQAAEQGIGVAGFSTDAESITAQVDLLEAVAQGIADSNREVVKALEKQANEAKAREAIVRVRRELARTDGGNREVLIDAIIRQARGVKDGVKDLITAVNTEIGEAEISLKEALAKAKREVEISGFKNPSRSTQARVNLASDTVETLEGLGNSLQAADAQTVAAASESEELKLVVAAAAIEAQVLGFIKLQGDTLRLDRFKEALKGKDSSNEALGQIESLAKIAKESLNGAIRDLILQVDSGVAAEVKARFKTIQEVSSIISGEDSFADRVKKFQDSGTVETLQSDADAIRRSIDKLNSGANRKGVSDLLTTKRHLFDELATKERAVENAKIARFQTELDDLNEKQATGSEKKVVNLQNQIKKAKAERDAVTDKIANEIGKLEEQVAESVRAARARLAELDAKAAQSALKEASAAGDFDKFRAAIELIDEAAAAKVEAAAEALKSKLGFDPDDAAAVEANPEQAEVYFRSLEDLNQLHKNVQDSAPKFLSALQQLTSSAEKAAAALKNITPSTGSVDADSRARRAGVTGDVRRRQQLQANLGSANLLVGRAQSADDLLQANNSVSAEDKLSSSERLKELKIAVQEAKQAVSDIDTTLAEKLVDSFSLQSFKEGLEDAEFAAGNLAQTINDQLVQAVDDVGEAFVDAILDGENFGESVKAIVHEIARDIFTTLIQSGIRTALIAPLQGILTPASAAGGASSVLGGIAAGVPAAAAGAEEGEEGGGEGAGQESTLAKGSNLLTLGAKGLLSAASSTLQNALRWALGIGQQAVATTTLTSAASLLTASATQLSASAVALSSAAVASGGSSAATAAVSSGASSGGGSSGGGFFAAVASFFSAATGGILSPSGLVRYARGGIIKGPGSGLSDSIPGIHINGSKSSPIAVSNGEAILNAKAVNLLGPDFIHALNSRKFKGFNSGGLVESAKNSTGRYKPGAKLAAAQPASNQAEAPLVTVMNFFDRDELAEEMLNSPAGTKAMLNVVGKNPRKFKGLL